MTMLVWQVTRIAVIHTWRARYDELLRADRRARTPRDRRAVAREDRALVAEALAAVAEQLARLSAALTRVDALVDRRSWSTTATTTEYGGTEWTIAERSSWPPGLPLEDLAERTARKTAERESLAATIDQSGESYVACVCGNRHGVGAFEITDQNSWPVFLPLEVTCRLIEIQQLDDRLRVLRQELQLRPTARERNLIGGPWV